MSSQALVSVVIPTYNYAKFIAAAVDSVLAQTYRPLEVIVVDDGSTDDTQAVLAGYGNRIKVILKSNGGVSAARNAGIQAASGEFVALLDADDVWVPEKLHKQLDFFERHPDAGCIGCGIFFADGDLNETRQGLHNDVSGPVEQRLKLIMLRREWVGGSNSGAVIRRNVLDEVGAFDEKLEAAEDWDLWLRIAARYPIYNIRESLVHIRRHFTGTFRNADKMERSQLAVLRKHVSLTPEFYGITIRRRVLAIIWVDSARERIFAGQFWAAARRLLRAVRSWPFRQDVWKLLAVCMVRGFFPKKSPMKRI